MKGISMRLTRLTLATASSVLMMAALASCGSDPAEPSDSDVTAPEITRQGGGPGASGKIADITGKTVQVQDETAGQVAVTWTAKTTFTEEVEAGLDDISVGTCVAVLDDQVRITEPTGDGCGMPGGPRMDTEGSGPPPTDMPSDGPVRIGGTVGEVTAVSADGFTVGDDEVVVSADTTYVQMAESDDGALEVGRCLSAFGDADDTGAVTAERISVTDEVDDRCGMVMRVSR
jgi:hypothetical protein